MIPEALEAGLIRYRDHHIGTGGFLRAVLGNQLSEAMLRADDDSAGQLPEIMRWIWEQMPAKAWGNPAKVDAWLRQGPLR